MEQPVQGQAVKLETLVHHHLQEELLATHFRRVVLAEGDDAGQQATSEIALRLARRTFVRIAPIPMGRQTDELTNEEIRQLLPV